LHQKALHGYSLQIPDRITDITIFNLDQNTDNRDRAFKFTSIQYSQFPVSSCRLGVPQLENASVPWSYLWFHVSKYHQVSVDATLKYHDIPANSGEATVYV